VLSSHESVAQVAVVARENSAGEKVLVGYVVVAEGQQIDPAALCRHVAKQLPEYMVPAALVVVPELPLSPNGKLDCNALPAPESDSAGRRAPRTPEEEILAGLFAEVLHLERVGIDDNFFNLGGHSLVATRLINRIRSTLGIELSVRTMFESPTVAALAQHLPMAQRARLPLRVSV
jgi:acyl carrier protein